MDRFKRFIMTFAALCILAAVPAQAAFVDMWANVYKWTGGMTADGNMALTRVSSGITFKVLAVDSDTAETTYVYANKAMTSLTNPITTANFESSTVCNDRVAFRVDPTDSTNDRYVDLIVVDTNGGYSAFVENFDKFQHTIVIDERPNVAHHGVMWFSATTTPEKDTGIDFLADTFIHDVWAEVVAVSSGSTITIGLLSTETNGDADGFRASVSVTTAGFVKDTGVITNGSTVDYTAASTYGALLYTAITGTDSTTGSGGGRSYIGHVVTGSNAKSLTYTTSGSAIYDGYIHYFFTRMR